MPCIKKEDWLKPLDLGREKFPIPALGQDAYVNIQALSSRDLLDIQERHGTEAQTSDLQFSLDLLRRVLVDDDGKPLFESGDDIRQYLNCSIAFLETITRRALSLSGLDEKKSD